MKRPRLGNHRVGCSPRFPRLATRRFIFQLAIAIDNAKLAIEFHHLRIRI